MQPHDKQNLSLYTHYQNPLMSQLVHATILIMSELTAQILRYRETLTKM